MIYHINYDYFTDPFPQLAQHTPNFVGAVLHFTNYHRYCLGIYNCVENVNQLCFRWKRISVLFYIMIERCADQVEAIGWSCTGLYSLNFFGACEYVLVSFLN